MNDINIKSLKDIKLLTYSIIKYATYKTNIENRILAKNNIFSFLEIRKV